MRPKATVIYHLQMWDQEGLQSYYQPIRELVSDINLKAQLSYRVVPALTLV